MFMYVKLKVVFTYTTSNFSEDEKVEKCSYIYFLLPYYQQHNQPSSLIMHLRSLALLFLFSEQTRGFAPSIVCTLNSCKETVSKTFLSSSNSLESESSTVELEAEDIASVENVSNLDQEFEEVIEDASNVDTKALDLLKEELISKASPQDSEITASPHLTFGKYLTMQV